MGPPKALDVPKPASSVRTRRIFGASLGGVTSLGKSGVESLAERPIWPLKGSSGRGNISWASAGTASPAASMATTAALLIMSRARLQPGCIARLLPESERLELIDAFNRLHFSG